MSSEPKACPFCGSDADNTGQNKEFVSCSSPDCSQRWGWYKVDWWNRRTPSPAVRALVEALKSLRRSHYINEDDPWYSCPAATGDYACSNDNAAPGCNCGADDENRRINDALAAVEREIGDQFADASKKVEGGSDAHR